MSRRRKSDAVTRARCAEIRAEIAMRRRYTLKAIAARHGVSVTFLKLIGGGWEPKTR